MELKEIEVGVPQTILLASNDCDEPTKKTEFSMNKISNYSRKWNRMKLSQLIRIMEIKNVQALNLTKS